MSANTSTDSELPGNPPRKATLTSLPLFARFWFLLIACVLIFAVPYFWYLQNADLIAIMRHGITTQGVLVTKLASGASDGMEDVRYLYHIKKDRYSGLASVPVSEYSSVAVGGPLTVYYLKRDPSTHHLGPVNELIPSNAPLFLGWAVLLIALFWLWTKLEKAWGAQIRLLRSATAVKAKVSELKAENGKYLAVCEFPAEEKREPKTYSLPKRVYDTLSVGSPITILVDTNSENKSRPFLALTRVALAKPGYFWQRMIPQRAAPPKQSAE